MVAREWGSGVIREASSEEFPEYRSLLNATMQPSLPAPHWENALAEYIYQWKEKEKNDNKM